MENERVFLLDGMALAYRAYYAFIHRPLINSKGINTSAIFGFITFLNRILSVEHPEHIAVVFDTSVPTFRHHAYKKYKATRQKMPEDMSAQIPILKEIINAYNIPVIELDGYEADDIIGTLARQAEATSALAFLVSPDKDFMQLVTEKTKIFKPGRQGTDVEIVTIDSVRQKFGVQPHQIIDVFALTGDSSDNIPGVPGIGEKTAIPLIQRFGNLENLYSHLDEIEQKRLREKLETHRELAFLSKKLVTIDTNVPVSIDVHSLQAKEKNIAELTRLFKELEFRSLLAKLQSEKQTSATSFSFPQEKFSTEEQGTISSQEHSYTLIESEEAFEQLCSVLEHSQEFAFDTETTSTNPLLADLLGISFCLEPRKAWYIAIKSNATEPDEHDLFQAMANNAPKNGLSLPDVVKKLKPVFENSSIKKIGHNIKYDSLVLFNYGVIVNGISFDTMIASYLLRPDGRHSLDSVAQEYLNYKPISYDELVGKGKEQKKLREIPFERVSEYSCEDADVTFQLYTILKEKIHEVEMDKLWNEVEVPLIPVLIKMESTGVMIDVPYLESMSKELERQLTELTQEIYRLAGTPFNINSSQQLSEVLFTTLKLSPAKKTKTGYSTDMGVLESLHNEHPIIEHLLAYRQLSKLKSTYVDALPKLIHPKTGKVHTSFNQAVTATGRLSSSDPNLQNIPIRTEVGRAIRKAFIPSASKGKILSADYSQIELRVMAHISGDEGLREAFINGEDIHASTASKIFGVEFSEVTREMRRKAKEVNFGIMYGIGAYGLSTRLDISQTEAKEIIERYFQRFPKVQQYINDTILQARQRGYVTTLLGRRRYLPDITSRNRTVRQNAERQAINMPVQGTAADMIKIAMVKIDKAFQQENFSSAMILQVHDELVFDVSENELFPVQKLVTEIMESALPLNVPVVVDTGFGANWLEAH
ncbi:MAG: DNA polymerase I [Bacteroidetes bacterium]|nr:DNA polymerase I [Bacteroidota bacterium]